VGWDSIYSWAAHEIVRDEAAAGGSVVVGEAFLAPDGVDVPETVREIVSSEPDVIINSTVGDLNLLYSRVLRAAGVTPQRTPTIYLSVGEAELLSLTASEAAGDYAVWSYFQTIDRPENRAFVERFRARYGAQRVTNDPMEAAMIAVNLWAKAMEDAGSEEVAAVRAALGNQVYEAPEGRVNVDRETQHIWKTTRVGQVRSDNHFDILWSSEKPIRPEPFPASRPPTEWASFLADRYRVWGGRWTAPSRAPR
jgi:urea transport system substrate-binding protein